MKKQKKTNYIKSYRLCLPLLPPTSSISSSSAPLRQQDRPPPPQPAQCGDNEDENLYAAPLPLNEQEMVTMLYSQ